MVGGAVGVAFGATARVYCVHNMAKRIVTDLAFNPKAGSAHLCSCCENLFVEATDTPMFCATCREPAAHALGGPLPQPNGRV